MTASAEWRVSAGTLGPGATAKFRLAHDGRTVEGFLVRWGDAYHAYVNRCPHVGTPLDIWPNEFLTEDGRTLICSTHGALFAPDSGRCFAGPCAGDALTPLAVRRDGETLVVAWPPDAAGGRVRTGRPPRPG